MCSGHVEFERLGGHPGGGSQQEFECRVGKFREVWARGICEFSPLTHTTDHMAARGESVHGFRGESHS